MTILSRNWLCRKSSHDHFAPRMVMLPSKNNQSWPILVMRHFDKEHSANWAIFRKEINFIQLSSYLFSSIGKTLLHSFCLNAEGATPYDAAPSVVLSEEEGFFYDSKHFLSRKRLYWLPKTIKYKSALFVYRWYHNKIRRSTTRCCAFSIERNYSFLCCYSSQVIRNAMPCVLDASLGRVMVTLSSLTV